MQAARAARPAQLRQPCLVELVAMIGKHLTRSDNEGAESYDRVAVVLCADNVTGNIMTCPLINLAIHETIHVVLRTVTDDYVASNQFLIFEL